MTGPFPGMDPYLEEPRDWPGVHGSLIFVMREMLAAKVSPRFFVASETSIHIVSPEDHERRPIVPDLFLVERPLADAPQAEGSRDLVGGAPVLITPIWPSQLRQHYLEIRERDSRRVVTTVKLLSPANKAPGSDGFDDFYRKRQRIMSSPTHWIEIDLLRAGHRPAEVRGMGAYYVLLKRGGADSLLEVWPIDLRDRLPTIAVPLTKPLPDVPLDLQAALDTVYARYHYEDGVNYDAPPPPPALDEANRRWLAEQLHAWRAPRAGQDGGDS